MIPALALTATDVTILRAACLDGAAALAAVDDLRRTVDIDALDWGRQRLLPILHRNLVRLGVGDWHASRLKGVRRFFWARSEVRLRGLSPVVTALRAAGIRTAVLKGAGIVGGGFEELSARPMDDLDVLVPPRDLPAAVTLLAGSGFGPRMVDTATVLRDVSPRLPGWPFVDAAGNELDLHWHVLHADCRPRADDAFWEGARPGRIAGIATEVLDPTDQLLQAIAHAARWNDTSTPRWASDALTLIRTGVIDWERLVAAAQRHRVVPAIHDGLVLLDRHLEAAVPERIVRRLGRWPRPLTRLEFAIGSAAQEARIGWRPDALALFERRRRSALLWRLPLAASACVIAWEGRDRARGAARVAFRLSGERRRVRRLVHLDRWARPTAASLPPLAAGGAPEAYLDGWHPPDGFRQWSAAREARMGWTLPPGWHEPLRCTLALDLLAPDRLGPQKLRIFANDRLVASWRSRTSARFEPPRSFVIPRAAVRGQSRLILTFAVDAVHVPVAVGVGPDRRPLGVAITEIAIAPLRRGNA